MEFTAHCKVKIFDFNTEIVIRRKINDLRIKDLEKLKQKVEALEDDDYITVKIIPNPDGEGYNDCVDELLRDLC